MTICTGKIQRSFAGLRFNLDTGAMYKERIYDHLIAHASCVVNWAIAVFISDIHTCLMIKKKGHDELATPTGGDGESCSAFIVALIYMLLFNCLTTSSTRSSFALSLETSEIDTLPQLFSWSLTNWENFSVNSGSRLAMLTVPHRL